MRELLEAMCQFTTNVRRRLDEMSLLEEDRECKSHLVEHTEDLEKDIDMTRAQLLYVSSCTILNVFGDLLE
jgi:hypothetical protein